MLITSNVHERTYPVPAERLGPLLDTLASADDRIWPRNWPPIRFDRPLSVGATGGHGMIRYSVCDYQPGQRVVCRFDPSIGLAGTHALELHPAEDGRTTVRHVLLAQLQGQQRLRWALVIRWLHNALLEDLLDRVGTELGHAPQHRARWSPWVRLLRRLFRPPVAPARVAQSLTATEG